MKIKTIYFSIFLFCLYETSWSAQLQINTQTGKTGELVTFTVFIHNAPDPVNAFGFEIAYDPTCMTYQSVQRGALISNGFTFFQASNVGFGRIRIGGIETGDHLISKEAVGSLALIEFNIIGDNNSYVKLENLKDDLKTWTTQNGQLILQTQETDDTTEIESSETENNNTFSENDFYEESNSNSSSDEERLQSQTAPETMSHPKAHDIITNNYTEPTNNNNTFSVPPLQNHEIRHPKKSQTLHQSTVHGNNLQQFRTGQQQSSNNSTHTQQSSDENKFSQTNDVQHNFQKKYTAETLETMKINDWGHIKSSGFSAANRQKSVLSNQIFKIPAFVSVTIVISILLQMGILMVLILIYRQLIRNERRGHEIKLSFFYNQVIIINFFMLGG